MRIGIDLDNTLVYSKLFDITFQQFGKRVLIPENWEMTNFPKEIRNTIVERFDSPYYMCDKNVIVPFEESKKVLNQWKMAGHELYIITARSKGIRLETRKMINRLFPMVDKTYFVNRGERKENIFKRLKLDMWVDDNPYDCEKANQMGIKTYMICNERTKYNHNLKNKKGIVVVENIGKIGF